MSEHSEQGASAPRFLTDANFRNQIVAGLRQRIPEIDLVTAKEAGLLAAPDPEILAYAKAHNRILLTHDKRTMPVHFACFIASLPEAEHSPGVMYLAQTLAIGIAIDAIHLVWAASAHEEWRDRETYLP